MLLSLTARLRLRLVSSLRPNNLWVEEEKPYGVAPIKGKSQPSG